MKLHSIHRMTPLVSQINFELSRLFFFLEPYLSIRYAARHVADYLRKYFDFSKSERDDIKDVSRIQLRSGSITAFLRHMWGLSKDRDENDLHHATDALVVACSTYGHVYLVACLQVAMACRFKWLSFECLTPLVDMHVP